MCAGVSLVQRVAVQETQEQKWKRKYGKVPALKFARLLRAGSGALSIMPSMPRNSSSVGSSRRQRAPGCSKHQNSTNTATHIYLWITFAQTHQAEEHRKISRGCRMRVLILSRTSILARSLVQSLAQAKGVPVMPYIPKPLRTSNPFL